MRSSLHTAHSDEDAKAPPVAEKIEGAPSKRAAQ